VFIADRKRGRPKSVGIKAQPAQYKSAGTKPAPDRKVGQDSEMQKAESIDELSFTVTVTDQNSVRWTDSVKLLVVRFAEWAGWLTSVEEADVQAYLRSHTLSRF
jgi:hypothetical protein